MGALSHKMIQLSGWGQEPSALCKTYRPEKTLSLTDYSAQHMIMRGCGRSYGDAALQTDATLLTERLDYVLAFDKELGVVSAQAGLTIASLLDIVVPHGWIVPAIAGTKHVSLGGAVASNIHGKNHYKSGDFSDHVISFTLQTPDGQSILCSKETNSDLFYATIGGMGMTGAIEDVTFSLRPISSLELTTDTKQVDSIDAMITAFESSRDISDYMVGWIDHFGRGDQLGRGVFERASHCENGTLCADYVPPKKAVTIPPIFPSWTLNRYSMAYYNKMRFRRYSEQWKQEKVAFDGFFHPLDNMGHWYRLYGKRGLYQYQCIIPEGPDVATHLREILKIIQSRGLFSYLAVLKYHRPSIGMMSFGMAGYSLALDFPATPQARQLQGELNKHVVQYGGRVYLAKDACLSASHFKRMYGHALVKWREVLMQVDPDKRMQSHMSKRLEFRDD